MRETVRGLSSESLSRCDMQESSKITRRQFTKRTAGYTALATSAPALHVLGANDKIRLGFIGLGGRGSFHLRQILEHPKDKFSDVEVVALCDAYLKHLEKNAERVDHKVQKTQDFRHILDNKDVDAVFIATPDHWHALQAILACQAGKDVYVEKPMSRTIEEGQRLIEAVDHYNRVVAVGQQQRSMDQFQEAVRMVKDGEIGRVTSAECINVWPIDGYLSGGPEGIGHPENSEPPEGLDYEMWLGPAPKRPFNPNRFLVNFYFFLDYSGGMLTAWGVHLFDIVMWAMGPEMSGVTAYGGKYAHGDARDTPDTAEVLFDTPGYTFRYTLRHGNGFPNDPEESGIDHGIYFYGDKATILVNRKYLKIYPEKDRKNPQIVKSGGGDMEHKRNFFDCIHGRMNPICNVRHGHEANLPGLLGLIAWQVGREIKWDPLKETIVGDSRARRMMSRQYRRPWKLPKIS